MIWFMVLQVVSTLVELVRLGRKSESEKELEIVLLRRQLAIYLRTLLMYSLNTYICRVLQRVRPHQGLGQRIPDPMIDLVEIQSPNFPIQNGLTRIPNDTRVVLGPLVIPGGIDQLRQIVFRSPAKPEFSFCVVQPR